jgi:hypothetical protein
MNFLVNWHLHQWFYNQEYIDDNLVHIHLHHIEPENAIYLQKEKYLTCSQWHAKLLGCISTTGLPEFDDPSCQHSALFIFSRNGWRSHVGQEHCTVLPASSVPLSQCSWLYPGVCFNHLALLLHISPSYNKDLTTALHSSAHTGICYITWRQGQGSSNPGKTKLMWQVSYDITECLRISHCYQEYCKGSK